MNDSSSKLGYFEQKHWPGTGSSPKTAGSQSVKRYVNVNYLGQHYGRDTTDYDHNYFHFL